MSTEKENAILHATLELIAERGLHDIPMSQVAKHAGVSTGIIYHYFENKDALIEALYHHVKRQLNAALIAGDVEALPFPVRWQQLWLNAFHFYAAHPQETVFLEQFENLLLAADVEAEAAADPNKQRMMTLMMNDFEMGLIKPLPYPVLYELTLGAAVRLAKQQVTGAVDLDEATLRTVAAAVCAAVATEYTNPE